MRASTKLGLSLLVFSLVILVSYHANKRVVIAAPPVTNYLKKPTGPYRVGFQDFHWVNQSACPDVNFNGKNQDDFSPGNTKYCHEVFVRIYYPTLENSSVGADYSHESIDQSKQLVLSSFPNVSKKQLDDLNQVKSFSIQNALPVKEKSFPIAFFVPGLGTPAQSYENYITNLVSYGYIVVGMNTPFINTMSLMNGHLVMPISPEVFSDNDARWVEYQSRDLIYVFNKAWELHDSNSLFFSMDLNHAGAFSHSFGGRSIIDIVRANPGWFKAVVLFDTALDTTGRSFKSLSIPIMYEIAPKRRLLNNPPQFELGKNEYLVGLAASAHNLKDLSYSAHLSFSDLSTLQYIPLIRQSLSKMMSTINAEPLRMKWLSHDLTSVEIKHIDKPTYVCVKKHNQWSILAYVNQSLEGNVNLKMLPDLANALANLPDKSPETLSDLDILPAKNILTSVDHIYWGLPTGNGFEITDSINTYLVHFLDMYLKDESSSKLKHCIPLTRNTFINCGPGVY